MDDKLNDRELEKFFKLIRNPVYQQNCRCKPILIQENNISKDDVLDFIIDLETLSADEFYRKYFSIENII